VVIENHTTKLVAIEVSTPLEANMAAAGDGEQA